MLSQKVNLFAESHNHHESLKALLDFWVLLILSLMGVWTVTCQIGMFLNLPFWWVCSIFSIFFVSSMTIVHRLVSFRFSQGLLKQLITLIIFCFIFGIISYLAKRPDWDDVNYLSRAVYYFDDFSRSLDLKFHHHVVNAPGNIYILLFYCQDLLWAFLAKITGLHPLSFYHGFLSFVGGMAIPFVWFYAFYSFTRRFYLAILSSIIIISFLLIDGVTHRSFGNFSFVRIWQSKAILMSIYIPLFQILLIQFFSRQTITRWMLLFLCILTATGTSPSALFLVTFQFFVLGVTYLCLKRNSIRKRIRVVFLAGLCFVHFIVAGLIAFYKTPDVAKKTIYKLNDSMWPAEFGGQFQMVFGNDFSKYLLFLCIIISIGIYGFEKKSRRFIILSLVFSFLLVLNPFAYGFISLLTTSNAYWRLFHILPFPLVLGGISTFFVQNKLRKTFLIAALCVIVSISNYFPNALGTLNKSTFFNWRIQKLHDHSIYAATKIIEACPKGDLLAPVDYSAVIPLFTSQIKHMAVRDYSLIENRYILNQLFKHEQWIVLQEGEQAHKIYRGDYSPRTIEAFSELLKYPWDCVLVPKQVENIYAISKALSYYYTWKRSGEVLDGLVMYKLETN